MNGKNIRGWIIECIPYKCRNWMPLHDNTYYVSERIAKAEIKRQREGDAARKEPWRYRVLPLYTIDFIEDETTE